MDNFSGYYDYELRILGKGQKIGIATTATLLLAAALIFNVSAFSAHMKRSLTLTVFFSEYTDKIFLLWLVWVRHFLSQINCGLIHFQENASIFSSLSDFIDNQRYDHRRFHVHQLHFANDQRLIWRLGKLPTILIFTKYTEHIFL